MGIETLRLHEPTPIRACVVGALPRTTTAYPLRVQPSPCKGEGAVAVQMNYLGLNPLDSGLRRNDEWENYSDLVSASMGDCFVCSRFAFVLRTRNLY